MDMTDALRYFGALAIVLALVGVAGLALRRFGLPGFSGGAGRRLCVVETQMLGKNHRLFIVRCDGMDKPRLVDPKLVSHILVNLLGNALKYSPPDTAVTCTASADGELGFMDRCYAVAPSWGQ